MGRRTTGAAIACAAMIALGGCGGSSGPSLSAFKTAYAARKASFSALGTQLGDAITGAAKKSNAELATEFGTLAQGATQQAAALRKLDPPSKYKAELDSLATSFDTVAADLKGISTDATTGNANGAKTLAEKLVIASAALKVTDTKLTQQLGLPASG
jgi:hypothetical protein